MIANRLWKQVMGRGLIEPVDDLLDSTAASHPKLMRHLERIMIESGYDMKAYLRAIFTSKAYQRMAATTESAPGAVEPFTGPQLQRLTAEQIWDSFVALINPNPEAGDWKNQQKLQVQLAHGRVVGTALGGYRPEQIMDFAKEIATFKRALADRRTELIAESRQARVAKETDRVKELTAELKETQAMERQRIHQLVHQPALRDTEIGLITLVMPDGHPERVELASLLNVNGTVTSKLGQLQRTYETEWLEREVAKAGITDAVEKRSFLAFRRAILRTTRAAHLNSPAPAGHFLRTFGQSDRDLIENASDEPQIPQALELMNGTTFDTLSTGNSVLARRLKSLESQDERLEVIYLSLLSRKPTDRERQVLASIAAEAPGIGRAGRDFRVTEFDGVSLRAVTRVPAGIKPALRFKFVFVVAQRKEAV